MASTINISLPEPLMSYIAEQTVAGDYASAEEFVTELIRMDSLRPKRDLGAYLNGVLSDRSKSVEISDEDWRSGNVVATLKANAHSLR